MGKTNYNKDNKAVDLHLEKNHAIEAKLIKVRRLAGSGEKAFESPAEVDTHIRELRKTWKS